MANFTWQGLDEYMVKLEQLDRRAEGICKQAVYDGAAIVIESVKKECPVGEHDEHLRDSIGLSNIRNDNGYINTKLGFDGYRQSDNQPFAKIAASIISGTSRITKKNKFVTRGLNKVKKQCESAMARRVLEEIEKSMK